MWTKLKEINILQKHIFFTLITVSMIISMAYNVTKNRKNKCPDMPKTKYTNAIAYC